MLNFKLFSSNYCRIEKFVLSLYQQLKITIKNNKMRNFKDFNKKEQTSMLNVVLAAYPNLGLNNLKILVKLTEVNRAQFAYIADYQSDKSNGTETASHQINVAASYQNMLTRDEISINNLDIKTVDVNNFNYLTLDMDGLTIDEFKVKVTENLTTALIEMQAPKAEKNTDATIGFNKVLFFNTNTNNLSIRGQSVNKTVSVQGDFKIVKSHPKTIAKRLIEKTINSRTASLRTFNLPNIMSRVSINGVKLDIA